MDNNQFNVLIIDQDKFLLGLYANALHSAGFNVEGVLTGKEGISIIENKIIENRLTDAIIMDIIFQDMNAVQFLRHLYSNAAISKIPIILVSNYNTDSYDKIAKDMGIYKRLMKFENTTDDILENVIDVLKISYKF